MLTQTQIDSLPAGFFPNSYLRRRFNSKHGHVVKAQAEAHQRREPGNGKVITVEAENYEFIGNRSQWLMWNRRVLPVLKSATKKVDGRAQFRDAWYIRLWTWFKKLWATNSQ